ncbi:MAG: PIG-L family deacetylase, partial [Anaerolineae bacterium]|nr:PIG-L family deacetylase [Anaerolineae bacterium]
GSAGSVARWTDAGAQVTYCIVTNGAAGSNEKGVDYVQLAARRRQEQTDAAKVVGVTDVRFLDYQDGVLQPTLELRLRLTRLIRELRPDRVVINDPTLVLLQEGDESYINHPDHRAAAEAALYAVFPSAESRPIFPELLDEGLEPHHVEELYLVLTEKPNIAVDITPAHDRKIEALLMHRSQVGEEAADFVNRFDKQAGEQVGVEFAETFRVMTFYHEPQSAKDGPTD